MNARWISNGPDDGQNGGLFIVQARPETVANRGSMPVS